MKVKTKYKFKKGLVNFFGAVGYMSCSFQWLWAIVANFSLISNYVVSITPKASETTAKHAQIATASGSPDLAVAMVAGLTMVVVVALTIYALIKIPSTLVRASKKVVDETAQNIAPAVLKIQHKRDNTNNRKKLSYKLMIAVKFFVITIPVALTFASQNLEKQTFDFYLVMYIGVWLAVFSLASFVVQHLLAMSMSVKKSDLL